MFMKHLGRSLQSSALVFLSLTVKIASSLLFPTVRMLIQGRFFFAR